MLVLSKQIKLELYIMHVIDHEFAGYSQAHDISSFIDINIDEVGLIKHVEFDLSHTPASREIDLEDDTPTGTDGYAAYLSTEYIDGTNLEIDLGTRKLCLGKTAVRLGFKRCYDL